MVIKDKKNKKFLFYYFYPLIGINDISELNVNQTFTKFLGNFS